uniref:Uncharacterized protein n=1 Tax=Aegilops tauschii TaxID=37682 RepID=N1QS85_AEGTA
MWGSGLDVSDSTRISLKLAFSSVARIKFLILTLFQPVVMCDVCINGPPEMHDFKEEAVVFMNVLQAQAGQATEGMDYNSTDCYTSGRRNIGAVPDFRMAVSYIREKIPRFAMTDKIWWQGLARILEDVGYIQEAAEIGTTFCTLHSIT